MKSAIVISLLLAALAAGSCADETRRTTGRELPRQVRPLAFEHTVYERSDGECTGDTTPCITIRMRYPTAIAGTDTARKAINDTIARYLFSTLKGHIADSAEHSGTMDSLVSTLFGDYREFVQEARELRGFITPWEITVDGKVIYQRASVVTVEIATYSYTGGAHPNYWTAYRNFDPRTGQRLSLQDVTTDMARIRALAEDEFRRSQNLGAREGLGQAGYWFADNIFTLPDNFAFTDKGLLFTYNPYEIASYAQGPIELLLPYTRSRGLLKEEYIP